MKRFIPVLLILVGVVAGAARAANLPPDSGAAPIVITTATMIPQPPAIMGDDGVQYGFVGINQLDVAFVNTSQVPANEVTLRATYRGQTQVIHDKGTFAPQVTVERGYRTFNKQAFRGSDVRVTVAAVRFEDGTTWTPTALPLQQQH